jgi:alpha-N-arabinofuranosidase
MAKIKIDVERRIGKISPYIYGSFIEHLGRCIYEGIYDEESSRSDSDNIRQDVLAAAKKLNIQILRWPGGNFVSNYHWMDGIGPLEKRPKRIELAWNTVEPNRFGTDEFLRFCEKLGAEPYICVNMGSGSMEEGQSWVEYCNWRWDSYYANLRRKYGRERPYGVKYWGLGNEVYGDWQIGQKDAEEYVSEAREYAKVMKRVDPGIELVACGYPPEYPNEAKSSRWNKAVLEELSGCISFISSHLYVGNPDDDYYKYMALSECIEDHIRRLEAVIDLVAMEKNIKIALDEWNVWYRTFEQLSYKPYDEHGYRGMFEEQYNLEDALVVGMFLNAFIRHCDSVKIANQAQLVNTIAPIMTRKEDIFYQTTYYPFELFANHNRGFGLDVYVDCDVYGTKTYKSVFSKEFGYCSSVPYLDVSASYDEANKVVCLNVINKHKDESIPAEIENQHGLLKSGASVYEITGESIKTKNTFEEKENVKISEKRVNGISKKFTYEFPPKSITMLKLYLAL